MLNIIKGLLLKVVEDIDTGNSNLSDEECMKAIDLIKDFSRKDAPLSKYQAYTYLNMSRASFDNLVREGYLPKGHKQQGFKELSWNKKDLDNYIRTHSN